MTTTLAATTGHERGTPEYRRLGAALWFGGIATFVLVYSVQGLLPTLATEFGVSSSTSSLVLSATTGTLALAIVPLASVAESWGRARVMTWALAVSAVLALLAPLAPTFGVLIGIRALQGLALAALPALLMTHVTREVAPRWLGGAVGLLIAGNTIGGLSGRLVAGFVAEFGGWRAGMAAVGVVSLAATVAFRALLPPSVGVQAAPVRLRDLGAPLRVHLRDPGLRSLFGISFALMGTFVTVYNFLSFRLLAAPFLLPGALVGLVFLGYLAGTVTSTTAGRLGDRFGRRKVLWGTVLVALAGAWITVPDVLPLVLVGVLLLTIGFFGAHSVASSWVGRRSVLLPGGDPSQASSLYLLAYYGGSSVGGLLGGVAFDLAGWIGLVGYVTVLLGTALVLAVHLRHVPTP
ncbi:MFS transporter [Pseudonocardia abyssalis]|uniref:MFS transporter n=1 Tax=Pseudonocardia abyssalis TaxID=2792008 RepID=A0ABS6UM58_9PSEU|nr:MFS transporter [Pseudonocardia abyssalis]MBW0114914.1 MFS transporter [Pseudonocardia abyssalis]MBW0132884.1 MFS transporter [Pseudonocardia abyssalis]